MSGNKKYSKLARGYRPVEVGRGFTWEHSSGTSMPIQHVHPSERQKAIEEYYKNGNPKYQPSIEEWTDKLAYIIKDPEKLADEAYHRALDPVTAIIGMLVWILNQNDRVDEKIKDFEAAEIACEKFLDKPAYRSLWEEAKKSKEEWIKKRDEYRQRKGQDGEHLDHKMTPVFIKESIARLKVVGLNIGTSVQFLKDMLHQSGFPISERTIFNYIDPDNNRV